MQNYNEMAVGCAQAAQSLGAGLSAPRHLEVIRKNVGQASAIVESLAERLDSVCIRLVGHVSPPTLNERDLAPPAEPKSPQEPAEIDALSIDVRRLHRRIESLFSRIAVLEQI